ncbi:MAG: DUF4149 domain-containing protein [Steroidobacteraceae bacterium]
MTNAAPRVTLLSRLVTLVAMFWMGSLWTICAVVATGLFAFLDDRHLAGTIAGQFFHVATWLGLVFAVLLSVLLRIAGQITQPLMGWIVLAAAPPLANELGLLPVMESARQAGNMALFGSLHLVSVVLFAIAGIGTLVLVWRLTRPAA